MEDFGTLKSGGDCQEHYHLSDRFPSRDSRLWQDSLEHVTYTAISYTITALDDVVVHTGSGAITLTLPLAKNGRRLWLTKTGAGTATLVPTGDDVVSGYSALPAQLKAISTGWVVL